jgi:hypothetical protein
MSQQQTVLRVLTNIPDTISGSTWSTGTTYGVNQIAQYDGDPYVSLVTGNTNNVPPSNPSFWNPITQYQFLDLYGDIPIRLNKSIAELQDIGKKNSDYSVGLILPGSKKNNRFFEDFFNVDAQSLYFNATQRVNVEVLLNDQSYFKGYMRLNKVSVLDSKKEYDVTLYSTIGDLFGKMGNNLLKDLEYGTEDTVLYSPNELTFNHYFNADRVGERWYVSNFFKEDEYPYPFFYPIVHNGYNYESTSGATLPNLSGSTPEQTRLYTSTSPIAAYTGTTQAYAAGVEEYYINSPTTGLRDNQLKPALNVWSLIQLMFKTYGYSISGDFMNTPWIKSLYLYGYFSSEGTKFSYKLNNIQELPKEGVELIYSGSTIAPSTLNIFVCKRGTGIPCFCLDDITYGFANMFPYSEFGLIPAGTSGVTINAVEGFDFGFYYDDIPVADISTLRYFPSPVGTVVNFGDGDFVDFSLVIDENIKQIDLLSSIAKKFNLVFIPNPTVQNDIIIEPFDFFMGTGQIYDWTDKLSFDKGFTVEPALNYIESNLHLTDQEDGDEGNREFKIRNNRIYGRNIIYNPTSFKSEEKKIETIFSTELIRRWDDNIGLPLGINYSAGSEISSYDNQVRWLYKGVKSKPKLFFWMNGINPFIDTVGEVFNYTFNYNTYTVKLQPSGAGILTSYENIPNISHTMPQGLADQYKINNDSLSILFNSELPVDIGVQTYNTYTENDVYNTFYKNRITNLYDPNTRFVNGYFDLKYSDIQNLNYNDVIKLNEQYFLVNKINEFNLTNRELTKVELVQFNVNPQTYPERYFFYYYCDTLDIVYKFKTNFTEPSLIDTNFIWSIYYDQQVGSLTGSTSGFTSSFRIFRPQPIGIDDYTDYTPYTMYEVSEDTYNSSGIDWVYDTFIEYIYSDPQSLLLYALATFWVNQSGTTTGANVWESCDAFYADATTYGIRVGFSSEIAPCIGCDVTGKFLYTSLSPDSVSPITGYTSSNNATSWSGPSLDSYTVSSISSSGKYIAYNTGGGNIGFSRTSGSTIELTSLPSAYATRGVGVSPNGQFVWASMTVSGGYTEVFVSRNFGRSFTSIGLSVGYKDFTNMKISANNRFWIGTRGSGGVQYYTISNDFGLTWTRTEILGITSVSCSETGQYAVLGIRGSSNPFIISSNSGVTFSNPTNDGGATTSDNVQVAQSSSGQYIVGVTTNIGSGAERVYRSTDYGANWTLITTLGTSSNGPSLQMSQDGQYVYIAYNDTFYRSSDYGASFTSGFGPVAGVQKYINLQTNQ